MAHDRAKKHDLVLITNVPILTARDAETVYTQWRYRPRIEHTYRFDQEDGLDVEKLCVRTLERMHRIFVLLLIAALFVYHIAHTWPQRLLLWLRRLGGQLGLLSDLDGPYVLLAGIRAVLGTAVTLAFAHQYPFPHDGETCGQSPVFPGVLALFLSPFCNGRRRARHRGLAKTRLQNVATATAIDLRRAIALVVGKTRSNNTHHAIHVGSW